MKEGLHYGEKNGLFYHAHLYNPVSHPQTKSIIEVISATPVGKKEAIVRFGDLTFKAGVPIVVRNHPNSHPAWDIRLKTVTKQQ